MTVLADFQERQRLDELLSPRKQTCQAVRPDDFVKKSPKIFTKPFIRKSWDRFSKNFAEKFGEKKSACLTLNTDKLCKYGS
jgi:hypothetical protein